MKSGQTTRILILEPDEQLGSEISRLLNEAAPDALVEITRGLEQAQQLVVGAKPELFILDVDGVPALGQDFLYDLRTSHPNARAIILTGVHLPEHREQVSGLGAIHFLEKPVPHEDFVELVQRLLRPATDTAEKFQGSLRDLQFADIIQLKCMSGGTSVVEFTGPNGEKARVFFESGEVRHATAPGRQGIEAFNEILRWKGGTVSEVTDAPPNPRTIEMDWQHLLIEAVRAMDEAAAAAQTKSSKREGKPQILAVDDSLMLISFVKEVLTEANYDVTSASTGEEAIREARSSLPDLILLDFILPDMHGDEVCRRLLESPETAAIPVVYMSGYGGELRAARSETSNVIGFLNKPFTSDLLTKTVEKHMHRESDELESTEQQPAETEPAPETDFQVEPERPYSEVTEAAPEVKQTEEAEWWTPAPAVEPPAPTPATFEPAAEEYYMPDESVTGGAYFCGDTRFFSLNRALQIVANQKLTGTLRFFWNKQPVELFSQEGELLLATTRDTELYCPETPETLGDVAPDRIAAARALQQETGCPIFIALMQENLISQELAIELTDDHGQKLFAELWSAPGVRFLFEQGEVPDFATALASNLDVDRWALATLRVVQFPQLGDRAYYDPASIPAYTRDGFERVQKLQLNAAEAQFASQFNGVRSVQQIARNLRLDLKFASVTLFRFLALEIVECWPATSGAKQERKGVFQRLSQAIGLSE